MSQKTLYGIRNVAFYADREARYYLTRKARDTALASLRDLAVSRGLAVSAATAGIYPVKRVVRSSSSSAEALIESAAENERALAAHVEVSS